MVGKTRRQINTNIWRDKEDRIRSMKDKCIEILGDRSIETQYWKDAEWSDRQLKEGNKE